MSDYESKDMKIRNCQVCGIPFGAINELNAVPVNRHICLYPSCEKLNKYIFCGACFREHNHESHQR